MKISILISSYNKGSYLEECIQSCLNQNYEDYEIILIDNESSDKTEFILNKYKERITIKRAPKISEYSAVNQINLLNTLIIGLIIRIGLNFYLRNLKQDLIQALLLKLMKLGLWKKLKKNSG